MTTHFDPKIVVQFTASRDELVSWDRYARINLPMHLIRGEGSDILTADLVQRMTTLGPKPAVTSYPECGHAPSLSRPADIEKIRDIIGVLARQ